MQKTMGEYLCEFAPAHPKATKDGYVRTHILMAEKKLGRYLNPEECVHHIDENKYNNDLDNLMIFKTVADHSAFHKGVDAVCDGDVWHCPSKRIYDKELCPICGENYKDKKANMCIDCLHKFKYTLINNTDAKRPNRDILKNQIRTKSFVEIGRLYGVSDNAIRKWCKSYGWPYRARDISALSDEEWESERFDNTK